MLAKLRNLKDTRRKKFLIDLFNGNGLFNTNTCRDNKVCIRPERFKKGKKYMQINVNNPLKY